MIFSRSKQTYLCKRKGHFEHGQHTCFLELAIYKCRKLSTGNLTITCRSIMSQCLEYFKSNKIHLRGTHIYESQTKAGQCNEIPFL